MTRRDPIVVLTREPPDNDALAADLRGRGIETREYPCIETALIPIQENADALLAESDVIAFTSRRAVAGVRALGPQIARWDGIIAAVGPGTAQAVEEILGRPVDVIPVKADARALADAIAGRLEQGADGAAGATAPGPSRPGRILHVRGTKSQGTLSERLIRAGHTINEWTVYRTQVRTVEPLTDRRPSIIVLASPSAVDGFLTGNRADESRFSYVAIGQQTGRRLRERGVDRYREASRATPDGLLEAIQMMLGDNKETV